jgi:predicted sugar kinase
MRRQAFIFLAAALTATSAAARPSTLNMSCGEAAATVARAGAIVLSTGANTYQRFVVHGGYCEPGQITKPGLAPTIDSPGCDVGYICEEREIRFRHD